MPIDQNDDTKLTEGSCAKTQFHKIIANDKIRKMVLFFLMVYFLYMAYILSPLSKRTAEAPQTPAEQTEMAPAADESANEGTMAPAETAPAAAEPAAAHEEPAPAEAH